jgi:two-component system, sensor histidine kinase and response regulator
MDSVKVLAVDDVEENVTALAALLDQPGIELVTARSGNEALEALLKHDFALALLDVNMPEMDGFELAELMRGTERTKHIPIIFVTATAPERNRVFQGYGAGAVDFLFKPLDPRLLLSKVFVFAQLHRQKQQLAQQLDQLQQAQRMSDLFIGVLGHDLRSPLSNIVGAAALLERGNTEPEAVERKAHMILNASRRMDRLIQQLLDFALARIKGGIPITRAHADLGKAAHQAVTELHEAGTAVRVEVQGDTAGNWDPDRIMQVVSNLLSNALEHGLADGPITVRVDGADPDQVTFQITNHGTIPETVKDILFSPFKPRQGASRGVGLGLYIVEQIVLAHQGRVSVDSQGHTTTFIVTLQRGAPTQVAVGASPT